MGDDAFPKQFLETIAVSYTVASALITDPDDRVLLVKPHYRDDWLFVGGMVDKGESPHEGCAREIKEEIGLALPVGDLLLVDFVPQVPQIVDEPLTMYLFDGGVLDDPSRIRLQEEELADFGFFALDEAAERAAYFNRPRIALGLEARRTGRAVYEPFTR